jgi:hypothetical protein
MMPSASSSLITRFGIVLCEVFSAALRAEGVIPETLVANVGAFSFIDRPFSLTRRGDTRHTVRAQSSSPPRRCLFEPLVQRQR